MSIYAIGDLHLSFNENKPMNIFGDNWDNHTEKIKQDWLKKVKPDDTVFLIGDFSWSMKLADTLKDFEYINSLPGKKVLLKGNHDYWWTTIKSMQNFLKQNDIQNIEFLSNNSFNIENKILCGTRGWTLTNFEETENSKKIIKRECNRLRLSIESALNNLDDNKEIIVFLHYPPIMQTNCLKNETTPFMEVLKEFNIKKCYYGHLHGTSIQEAPEGIIDGIDLKLISADSVNFELTLIT